MNGKNVDVEALAADVEEHRKTRGGAKPAPDPGEEYKTGNQRAAEYAEIAEAQGKPFADPRENQNDGDPIKEAAMSPQRAAPVHVFERTRAQIDNERARDMLLVHMAYVMAPLAQTIEAAAELRRFAVNLAETRSKLVELGAG